MEDLGKLIVGKGFKSCPKSNKSPNLVTLLQSHLIPTKILKWKGRDVVRLSFIGHLTFYPSDSMKVSNKKSFNRAMK